MVTLKNLEFGIAYTFARFSTLYPGFGKVNIQNICMYLTPKTWRSLPI